MDDQAGSRRITHLCISDFHSGALTSLTTPVDKDFNWTGNAHDTTDVTSTFAAALNATLASLEGKGVVDAAKPPDLVLLGDGPDLSLSPPKRSFDVMGGFLAALYGPGHLSDQMVYVPGNHDHWVWSQQRYENAQFESADLGHATEAFVDIHKVAGTVGTRAVPPAEIGLSTSLGNVLSRFGMAEVNAWVAYPNFGIRPEQGGDNRLVVIHHGHFIENMYRAMSDLLAALDGTGDFDGTCEALERYNGIWIEFGWSVLGDTGLLGEDVAAVYQILLTGGASTAFQHRLAAVMKTRVAQMLGLPDTLQVSGLLDMLTSGIVDSLVGKFSQLERFDYTRPLSASSLDGLKTYLSGPVWRQIRDELGQSAFDPPKKPSDRPAVAGRTTFIFGHTHKPFCDQLVVDGYAQPVSLYNTGGWILDTSLLSTVQGASVVFVDSAGNTAALQLFTPPVNETMPKVAVLTADPGDPDDNPLFTALKAAKDANQGAWDQLAEAAKADFELRQKLILTLSERALDKATKTGGLV